ncbi:hypothetical protein LTR40_011152, partial [Exophiala xenobiotica]
IVRRVVEARRQEGAGPQNYPQYTPFGSKGHTPNVSGAGTSAYQMPTSMQPSQQPINPNPMSMNEKSGFEASRPWWKKIFCCG